MAPECYFQDRMKGHNSHSKVVFRGQKHGRPVYECTGCGLVFCPQESLDDYLKIYKDRGRYFSESVSVGYKSFEERFNHDYCVSEPRWLNLKRHLRAHYDRVLDVGCGNGALLKRLSEQGFRVEGVDLDCFSIQKTLEMGWYAGKNLELSTCDVLDFKPLQKFDIIMLTDSFEHFLYPGSYVQTLVGFLNPDGMMVIETPDVDCDGWSTQGVNWVHVKPKEHPFLYNYNHIVNLFKDTQLRVFSVVYTIPGRVIYYLR